MPDLPDSDDLPRTGNPATDYSIDLLVSMVRAGVRHIVLSPGSRSQALALVAAELERVGAISLHVRTDERVGAFTALGIGRETGDPAVVITTSGTATANLHPAVMEAFEARTPLIVVTADRPPELRGIRSNQTSWQRGLFASTIGLSLEAVATQPPTDPDEQGEGDRGEGGLDSTGSGEPQGATGGSAGDSSPNRNPNQNQNRHNNDPELIARQLWAASRGEVDSGTAPGPVHLNLGLREPLSAAVPDLSGVSFERWLPSPPAPVDEPFYVEPGPGTIVVAGDGAGVQAEEFARLGGFPLIAEVASGAHFGPNLVVAYRELLADAVFRESVTTVVVFGHPTLSREVPQLLSRGVRTLVVDPWGATGLAAFYSPGRVAHAVVAVRTAAEPLGPKSRAWVGSWVMASRRLLETRTSGEESVHAVPGTATDSLGAAAGIAAQQSPHVTRSQVEGYAAPASGTDSAPAVGKEPAVQRPLSEHRVQAAYARAALAIVREPVNRRMLVEAVWRFTWPHDRLVVGASRLIRDLDRRAPGRKVRVHANRGLAGIDGTVSTGMGVALAAFASDQGRRVDRLAPSERFERAVQSERFEQVGQPDRPEQTAQQDHMARVVGTTRILLGDLSFLHDAGALLHAPGEWVPPVQVIVGNDGGGTIFEGLEVAATASEEAMRRVMTTPRTVDLEALATAYGWRYRKARTRGELDQALSEAATVPTLIDVPLPD